MKFHATLRAVGGSLLLAGLTTLPAVSEPLVLELGFDTLPSEQGWQLFASYEEARIVALADGILSFDSRRDFGAIIAGGYRFRTFDVLPAPGNTVTFQARVVDRNPGGPGHGHFFVDVLSPRGVALLRVEDNEAVIGTRAGMAPLDERSHSFDAAAWHDYRMESVDGIGIKLFIDGHLVATNSSTSVSSWDDLDLIFGIHHTNFLWPGLLIELGSFRFEQIAAVFDHPTVTCLAEAEVPEHTPVTVLVSLADPNGDPLDWTAYLNGAVIASESIPASSRPLQLYRREVPLPDLPLGTNLVRIEGTDGSGQPVVSEASIEVLDTTPPAIVNATAVPGVLWPPNGKLVPIALAVDVTDNSGAADWHIVAVTCDQNCPERDIVFASDQEVSLCAVRSGRLGTRTYTIELQAEDEAGNPSAIETVTVIVPHDRGRRGPKSKSKRGD